MSKSLFTIDDEELDLGDEDFLLEACKFAAPFNQQPSSGHVAQQSELPKNSVEESYKNKHQAQTDHDKKTVNCAKSVAPSSKTDTSSMDLRTPLALVNSRNDTKTSLCRDIDYTRHRQGLVASSPASLNKYKFRHANLQTGCNSLMGKDTPSQGDNGTGLPPCKRPVLERHVTNQGYDFLNTTPRFSTPQTNPTNGQASNARSRSIDFTSTPSCHRALKELKTVPSGSLLPMLEDTLNKRNNDHTDLPGTASRRSSTPKKVVACTALSSPLSTSPSSSSRDLSSSRMQHCTPASGTITRKFPGPAGLLPKLVPGDKFEGVLPPNPMENQAPIASPAQKRKSVTTFGADDDFQGDAWSAMMKEVKSAGIPLMMQFTVAELLQKAALQQLNNGKVPYLCTLIKSFSVMGADASVVLKDQTGEIHGTVHRKALEAFHGELGPGAGILLKQVSVFSPSPRRHYINITPGNILKIYSPDPEQLASSQPLTTQCTQDVIFTTERDFVELMGDEDELLAEIRDEEILLQGDNTPNSEQFEDILGVLDDDDDIFNDEALLL